MAADLSPPKVVLLAAHFTACGDIASLASLAASSGDVLRKTLLLRILLTYLPSHIPTEEYLPLLQSLEADDFSSFFPLADVDASSVRALSDEQAAKKVRKLRLQQLALPGDNGGAVASLSSSRTSYDKEHATDGDDDDDDDDNDDVEPENPLALFLILRAYAVDDGSGALPELPGLFTPFLDLSPRLRTWAISVLLPLLRRNCEYYPDTPLPLTLADFEHLPDRLAVARLLSQTGAREETLPFVGRDLRGLIGPWLYNERRWASRRAAGGSGTESQQNLCPGWEDVLQWLTAQAAKSWRVAAKAIEQWDGPSDADLGGHAAMWFDDQEQEYLERRYARAALACVYLIPGASEEALAAAHSIVAKIISLLDQDPIPPLATDLSLLSHISPSVDITPLVMPRNAIYLRKDLLDEANVLTAPAHDATELLHGLILSAALMHKMGTPCTVRRAGELALLQNEREQTAEALKLIHWVAANGPKNDDRFWIKARNEILWLRDWGADDDWGLSEASPTGSGVFGHVKREAIEAEFLKVILTNTRYSLAHALYEDASDHPLSKELVRETVFAAAMAAYDNASNPNRTRGGLKKCIEIIHAFPQTVDRSRPETQRAEALLAATHALSDYRLVLKQGEPFTPVVLRVHQDPLSIISKVLEQNPRSYTRIQELVSIGTHMVDAGLTVRDKAGQPALTPEQAPLQRTMAERRVTAMCIDAALNEDDYETAYSYVVSRLASIEQPSQSQTTAAAAAGGQIVTVDTWSWRAALEAGKYRRTERTLRPTHLGTASANLDIRHLEQRIECLATALRVAPSDTLQEILNAYRRCEEELEAAVQAEEEQASAWDEAADHSWQHQQQRYQKQHQQQHTGMPGGFSEPRSSPAGRGGQGRLASRVAAAAAASAVTYGGQQQRQPAPAAAYRQHQRQQSASGAAGADDAPLSLFDLSRATARAAQRNLSALSSLKQARQLVGMGDGEAAAGGADLLDERGGYNATNTTSSADAQPHVRKRDQLREAAMGTLTSGVGWLIGAQPVDRNHERD